MRHFKFLMVMAAALLLAGGASALPSSGTVTPSSLCTPINAGAEFVPFTAGNANGFPMPGATVDFCRHYAEVRGLLDSNIVDVCSDPAYLDLCNLLVPCTADLNGQIEVDERNGGLVIDITGNGIPDAANELGVIKKILTTPSFNNGVLTYSQVLAAYEHNFYQIQCDMQVDNIAGLAQMLPSVLSGLVEILAVHITIGDGTLNVNTSDPTGNVTTATGSWGVSAGLETLLCGLITQLTPYPCADPTLDRANYVTLENYLGKDGDADGDGATNLQEAQWFTNDASCGTVGGSANPLSMPPAVGLPFVTGALPNTAFTCPPAPAGTTFLDAVLNPSLKPLSPSESFFVQASPYFVEVGDNITLKVTTLIPGLDLTQPGNTFQWKLDGGDIIGETSLTLNLSNLTVADNGLYTCLVTYGAPSGPVTANGYLLNVLPAGQAPVGGALAMSLLTGACALAGAMGIRRKN